jgi:hypothetical protein
LTLFSLIIFPTVSPNIVVAGRWSDEEQLALIAGAECYTAGQWNQIRAASTLLTNRTEQQIKDKWNYMCKHPNTTPNNKRRVVFELEKKRRQVLEGNFLFHSIWLAFIVLIIHITHPF